MSDKKEKKTKKKLSRTQIIIIVVVVIVICILGYFYNLGTQEELPEELEYQVVSSDTYAREGQECMSYRVAVPAEYSDDQLLAVFDEVTDDDYYLHIIWFYSDPSGADGSMPYDVAMLEQTSKGETPEITRN